MNDKKQPNAQILEKSEDYIRAQELAETGQAQQALDIVLGFLNDAPNDPEALNDAGAIVFSMGDTEKALGLLKKAKEIYPDSPEITWNLLETQLAAGDPERAVDLFEDMQQMGILNPDVLNRTAQVLLENEKFTEAVKTLERSLEMAPQQRDILSPMIETIRAKSDQRTQ